MNNIAFIIFIFVYVVDSSADDLTVRNLNFCPSAIDSTTRSEEECDGKKMIIWLIMQEKCVLCLYTPKYINRVPVTQSQLSFSKKVGKLQAEIESEWKNVHERLQSVDS